VLVEYGQGAAPGYEAAGVCLPPFLLRRWIKYRRKSKADMGSLECRQGEGEEGKGRKRRNPDPLRVSSLIIHIYIHIYFL
jgi:hypothetical protein